MHKFNDEIKCHLEEQSKRRQFSVKDFLTNSGFSLIYNDSRIKNCQLLIYFEKNKFFYTIRSISLI